MNMMNNKSNEATGMKTFIVLRTDYPMEVHAVGCKDLSSRKNRSLDQDWKITGETIEQAVTEATADLNADFEAGYPEHEVFRVMPCCKKGGK